jgi:uncharacterized membrane protein
MPSPRRKRLVAAVVFVSSVVVLAIQLITPSPVVVTAGETGTEVAELGDYFQYRDVVVIATAACTLGASGTYLLAAGPVRSASDSATRVDSEPTPPRPASSDGGVDESPSLEPSTELLEARKEEWEETADRLANKEREVYEALLDADGVLPQSDIVERTDLSKASVSRALDSLEVKNLVERKRRGMGNVILLQ